MKRFSPLMALLLSPGLFAAPSEETLTVTGASGAGATPAQVAVGTASRLGLREKEIPRHTETIAQRAIQAKGKRSLTEVVETAPGISGTTSPTLSNSVSLRGFTPLSWLYDGVEVPGSTIQGGDPVHYESVDILYGTGSVVNGLSAAGGSVNLIPRRASFSRQPVELDYAWSSYASHRAHVGAGGTLVDNLAAGRVDLSTSSLGSRVKDERQRPKRVTGALLLTPADNLLLNFNVDRMFEDTHNPYYGTPLVDGRVAKRLRHVNYNNLQDARLRSRATSVQATQTWLATPDLTLENKFYYYKGFREWHNAERYYPAADRPGAIVRDSFGDLAHDDRLTGNRSTVSFDAPLAGFDNRVIAGADVSRRQFDYYSNGFPGEDSVPEYAPPRRRFDSSGAPRRAHTRRVTQNQYALFAEDKLDLTDRVGLLGQLRYSHVNMDWKFRQQAERDRRRYAFTTVGLGPTWRVTDNVTLYANYSSGKEPGGDIFFISPSQTGLPLTRVRQYEVGAKADLPDNLGELKLAVYHLQKKNLFTQDALQSDVWNAVGKQTSKGIELSGVLQPLADLTLEGNAAWTHARFNSYQQGSDDLSGNRPRYVPTWTANLAARYAVTRALGVGTQLRYVGSSYSSDANDRKMSDYATVDASADYALLPGVTVGARVRNLTNEFYSYQRTYATQALIAPGRTYEAFVSMRL